MPWWGWLLVCLFTTFVCLIWAIRSFFRELANALFNAMDISIVDWNVLNEEEATETEGT